MGRVRTKQSPRVFLGAATMCAGNGGICRVARLTAKVLVDEGIPVDALALKDTKCSSVHGCDVNVTHGSQLKFLVKGHMAARSFTHFIYDFPGTARAHPIFPWLNRPSAVWVHGIDVWENLRFDYQKAIRNSNLTLVNSQYTKDKAQGLHGSFEKANVCWLGTEQDLLPQHMSDFRGEPVAFILGRIVEGRNKGHDLTLEVWPEVLKAVPNAKLVITGTGPGLDSLRKKVLNLKLSDYVEITGFVSDEKIEDLWSRAHVFIMPSRTEGFGLTYVEAMRYGVPVIASIHDAGQEINIDRETGYNIDLTDREYFTSCIINLLKNKELAFRMGRAGQKRWRKHFCYSAFRSRIKPILENFLAL